MEQQPNGAPTPPPPGHTAAPTEGLPTPQPPVTSTPQAQPAAPQAQPVVPQVQPETPQAQPVVPQVQPAAPQAQPVVPQAQPVVPQAQPVVPQAQPAAPQGQVQPAVYQPPAPAPAPVQELHQPPSLAGNQVALPQGVITYPGLNWEYATALSEGLDPNKLNTAIPLFPPQLQQLVIDNNAGLLPGGDSADDEELGIEGIERKRVRALKLVRNENQGTLGHWKIPNPKGDLLTAARSNVIDVFVLAAQVTRQYRVDKTDINTPPACTSFHTGAGMKQIPALFNATADGRAQPRICSKCPLAPTNPTFPRGKRCQSQFVFYVVVREDPTQCLRLFVPMKDYDTQQQRGLAKLFERCNNGTAIAGQTSWLTLTAQEKDIRNSNYKTASFQHAKGDLVSEEEAKIINFWRESVAVPFSEGEKSAQFLRVKNFLQDPNNLQTITPQGAEVGSGVQF